MRLKIQISRQYILPCKGMVKEQMMCMRTSNRMTLSSRAPSVKELTAVPLTATVGCERHCSEPVNNSGVAVSGELRKCSRHQKLES